MKSENTRPSEMELQILGLLWERGPLTARQVLGALPDGKERAYTTVLSTMQVMEKKKLVTRSSEGVTHVWRAAVTRRRVMGPILKNMARNVFGGSPMALVQQLFSERKMDASEAEALRRLLEEHDRQKGSR